MSDEEKKMSLQIWCDLLEAELKRALEDLSMIRGLDKVQAKSKSHMLRAALNNAQHLFPRNSGQSQIKIFCIRS